MNTPSKLEVIRDESTLSTDDRVWTYDDTLSIEIMRAHTKTNAVQTVTDDQLRLYRAAAIEAAEQYTGLILTGQKTIEETPRSTNLQDRNRGYFTHTTAHMIADSSVLYLGEASRQRVIRAQVGSNKIRIPVLFDTLTIQDCCNPCDVGINPGMFIRYKAGYATCKEIPAGIILGALKYIAWNVKNPGDQIMTVRNKLVADSAGIAGTNNIGIASGANELWRQYAKGRF